MSPNAQIFIYFPLFIFLIFNLITLGTVFIGKTKLMVKSENVGTVIDLDVAKFKSYLIQFNKTYSGIEYQVRLNNFKESLKEITKLNRLENRTVFGLTNFSDMSAQEFAKSMLKARVNSGKKRKLKSPCTPFTPPRKIPDSHKDWRDGGYIGPIQNQRLCNGCWAFATAGVIESMAKIYNLINEELSVQEVLDCILDNRHQDGCKGGNIYNTMFNLHYNKNGIVTEKEYPLTLRRENCQVSNLKEKGIKIKNCDYKYNVSDYDIMVAIMNGPVTAVVNAANWRNYVGGIIKWACTRPNIGERVHDVQIVGYDLNSDSIPYYIVRNSWGELFGENGYARVAMNNNVCGISDEIGIVYDVYT